MFDKKGYIAVPRDAISEEKLLEVSLEAGAEDLRTEGDTYAIYTAYEDLESVRQALEAAGIPIESSELTMVPQNQVHIEGKTAQQMLNLIEALEEHDDVQNVYANFDIDEEEMEALVS